MMDNQGDFEQVGEDLIDDFYTGGMWEGGLPDGQVLIGRIQEEARPAPGQDAVTKRNLYLVRTSDGRMIPDCILLQTGAHGTFTPSKFDDDRLPGTYFKPYPGALCALLTSSGGVAFIVGFFNPPTTVDLGSDSQREKNEISETNPGMLDDADARVAGDWIVRTEDALINIKRGGAILIESGASIRQTLNPYDGCWFSQSKKSITVAEGYKGTKGRIDKSKPQALSTDDYFDTILQRGRTSTRIRVKNGRVTTGVVRETSVSEIDYNTPTSPIETVKLRERYNTDGSWVSEGPKYQWGGTSASEPIVLGNKLVTMIRELSRIIKTLKVSTAWGPSGPPLPPTPIDLARVENSLDDIISDYMFTTKTPADPGGL